MNLCFSAGSFGFLRLGLGECLISTTTRSSAVGNVFKHGSLEGGDTPEIHPEILFVSGCITARLADIISVALLCAKDIPAFHFLTKILGIDFGLAISLLLQNSLEWNNVVAAGKTSNMAFQRYILDHYMSLKERIDP
jgi:hypothetical protein